MSLTEHEVRKLLATARSYDHRQLTDSSVLAWSRAAETARWTYDEAMAALERHYAESTEMAKPGHITHLIKHQRTRVPRRKQLPGKAPASDGHREAVMAQLRQRHGWVRRANRD